MKKTPTNGYYELPNNQMLHFSMNTWMNLKQDSGRDISEYGVALENGTDVEKAFAMAEIIFAAAKAHDQEESIEFDYNIYTIRGWFGDVIKAKEIEGITKALLWNTSTGEKSPAKNAKGKKTKGK